MIFNAESEQLMKSPFNSHLHSSEQFVTTLAGRITNHNQNITTGVATSNDTNTMTSLDGMASCCNLHRERKCRE
jgi:hypothetical protein